MIGIRNKTVPANMKDATIPWLSIPSDSVAKSFWVALTEYVEPLQRPEFPLANEEFLSLQHSVRGIRGTSPGLSRATVEAANELRLYYDEVSLWNPIALATHLGFAVSVVMQQLLLAKEYNVVNMLFVLPCHSCGCDMLTASSISEICFRATYHVTNIIRCPMCTECTEVTELPQIGVYFELRNPSPLLRRKYHRLFWSEEAIQRRLETYFCPPGAAFSFEVRLSQGYYLLVASGMGLVLHLHVRVGAEYLEPDVPSKVHTVILEKYLKPRGGGDAESEEGTDSTINIDHGKLTFHIFNGTPYGSYLDLCIHFDHRMGFLTPTPLVLATAPLVMHYLRRGLRSPLFPYFIPGPPGAHTSGVYALHSFDLTAEELTELGTPGVDSVVAVIREVHRYSLEDHYGILVSVGRGGSMFESLFPSLTAALASSLCLAQRVTTRLGEDVAAKLSSALVLGGINISSFRGQYDDAENLRSSYPDVLITGPVLYASVHPPIVVVDNSNKEIIQEKGEENEETYDEEQCENSYCVRFELRSVSEDCMGTCIISPSADGMLFHFLSFLEGQLHGLKIVREPQALVVVVPLATLGAKLVLSTLIDPLMYTRSLTGPFG